MQSAIRPRPICCAAIRLNPQPAMRKAQHRFMYSNRSSREVRSALSFAEIPNMPTKAGLEE
eukprot:8547445-Alexandrium_andersonii.AAC.1